MAFAQKSTFHINWAQSPAKTGHFQAAVSKRAPGPRHAGPAGDAGPLRQDRARPPVFARN